MDKPVFVVTDELRKKVSTFFTQVPKLSFNVESATQFFVDWDFAERTNQLEALLECMRHLQRIGENSKAIVYMYTDWAKHSYYFTIFPEDKTLDECNENWKTLRIMNGGVIYHGKDDDGTREETFSVELTPSNSWSIHT